jgi:hypothetical protein
MRRGWCRMVRAGADSEGNECGERVWGGVTYKDNKDGM